MRILLVTVLCCAVVAPFVQTQSLNYVYRSYLRPDYAVVSRRGENAYIGPVDLHGVIGTIPTKYVPLTPADEFVTAQARAFAPIIISSLPEKINISDIQPEHINVPSVGLSAVVCLRNFVVQGINRAVVKHLEIRTENNRVDFVIATPQLSASAYVNLAGNLSVLPLEVQGTVSLPPQDLTLTGAVALHKDIIDSGRSAYQIYAGDVFVTVQNIDIDLHGAIRSSFNTEHLKSFALNQLKDEIANLVLSIGLQEINRELRKYPFEYVKALLAGPARRYF